MTQPRSCGRYDVRCAASGLCLNRCAVRMVLGRAIDCESFGQEGFSFCSRELQNFGTFGVPRGCLLKSTERHTVVVCFALEPNGAKAAAFKGTRRFSSSMRGAWCALTSQTECCPPLLQSRQSASGRGGIPGKHRCRAPSSSSAQKNLGRMTRRAQGRA